MENRGLIVSRAIPTTSSTVPTFSTPIMLDQHNYLVWKSQMVNELLGFGLLDLIDGTFDAEAKTDQTKDEEGLTKCTTVCPNFSFRVVQDKCVLSRMRSSISKEIRLCIPLVSYASSRSLWIALEERFATQSKAFLMELRAQFRSIRQYTPSITDYLERVKYIVEALEEMGKEIPKEDLVIQVLAGLGPEYESFEASINKRSEELSYDEVSRVLLLQKTRLDPRTLTHLQPIVQGNGKYIRSNKQETIIQGDADHLAAKLENVTISDGWSPKHT